MAKEDFNKLLLLLAIAALFTSGMAAIPVYADEDDDGGDDDDDDNGKNGKTFESECAKKKNFDKIICDIIESIQVMLDMVKADVAQLQADVRTLEQTPGPQGDKGDTGDTGPAGAAGLAGTSCWDLNGNGVGDIPAEDANGDGKVDRKISIFLE